jgi:hypothetical protein
MIQIYERAADKLKNNPEILRRIADFLIEAK